jgi:hypothetical protein
MKFTITNENAVVFIDGVAQSLRAEDKNFPALVAALLAKDWEKAGKLVARRLTVQSWLSAMGDLFSIDTANQIRYKGIEIDKNLNERILKMAQDDVDPTYLLKFVERLFRNPSYRSRTQLYRFLEHVNLPITAAGTVLAYKSVGKNMKDHHTNSVDNSVGNVVTLDRGLVSDDPDSACSVGLHLGTLNYARGFYGGSTIIVCEVDPEDVVCIPYDCDSQKMRCCKYKVLRLLGKDEVLPSTVTTETSETSVEPEVTGDAANFENSGDSDESLNSMSMDALRKYARSLGIKNPNSIKGGKSVLTGLIEAQKKVQVGQ